MPSLALPGIEEYAEAHTSPEPARLLALAAETREASREAQMMVGQLEGRFLKMLVHMVQPQLVLEIGMFTGYSALSMAEALPAGGRIITLELSSKHEAIARRHIEPSPFADRIEIRMGPALETLPALAGPFDLVFIDADKGNYQNYLEAVLPKLAPAGVIAVDNVLWYGRVLTGDESPDEDTGAIRAFNDSVVNDPRLECVLLPLRDGVTLIRKR
jgi:caffeoyl-CoA O-methyltransferase